MALENAADRTSGPGPWFIAARPGACSCCGDSFDEGDTIRADGWGSWECENCEDAGHPNRRDPFAGTTLDEMGY